MYLIIIIFIIVYYLNSNYWKRRNVAHAKNAAWRFLFGRCSMPEIYRRVYDSYPNEGYVGMFVGTKPVLVLKNLEDIQAVLKDINFHSRGYNVNTKECLADNLLLINDYQRWKMMRQKITPIFTPLKLKSMSQKIHRSCIDLIDYLKYTSDSRSLSFEKFNFVAITSAIFGGNFVTRNSLESSIVEEMCKPTSFLNRCQFSFKLLISNFFPKLLTVFNIKLFGDYKDLILNATQKAIAFRRETPGKGNDYIDLCMELNETIRDGGGCEVRTDQFIASQAFSFFVAGVETVASAIEFTLLELARNGPILERLHKEIDEKFNSSNVNYENVDNLVYLDMVLSESLRKYPPIGSMQRIAGQDTVLPSNFTIEKGTTVIIPIFALHMDSRYFEQPDMFDPERFSPSNIGHIKKYTYLPFSEGNRTCIGEKYARIQIKMALAHLLREFTLKPCSYAVKNFDPNLFNLHDSHIKYELIPRQ